MILTGREVKALLGATMLQAHVPFVRAAKPTLSIKEKEAVDSADDKLLAARQGVTPSTPREAPGWLELLLGGEADVRLGRDEMRVLLRVANACLAELRTDGDFSPHVGPGVGLAGLRAARAKVMTELNNP